MFEEVGKYFDKEIGVLEVFMIIRVVNINKKLMLLLVLIIIILVEILFVLRSWIEFECSLFLVVILNGFLVFCIF